MGEEEYRQGLCNPNIKLDRALWMNGYSGSKQNAKWENPTLTESVSTLWARIISDTQIASLTHKRSMDGDYRVAPLQPTPRKWVGEAAALPKVV